MKGIDIVFLIVALLITSLSVVLSFAYGYVKKRMSDDLYHSVSVINASGKPIREGDIVYFTGGLCGKTGMQEVVPAGLPK